SASISGLWSTPTTAQPVCRTSSRVTAAVPQARSTTVSARATSSRQHRERSAVAGGSVLEPRDEEAPPAGVLPEREQVRVAVVGGPERREQAARELGPGRAHATSLSSSSWRWKTTCGGLPKLLRALRPTARRLRGSFPPSPRAESASTSAPTPT